MCNNNRIYRIRADNKSPILLHLYTAGFVLIFSKLFLIAMAETND